ncbi:MAG: glycosyltransferase family 1 protein [Chloroflexi bacterium]|nr:glycosyltransferase family 1 protein [Chloroflexota bacterium]
MRIALDTQSTLGRKTGIGIYTTQLLPALRQIAPQHDYVELDWGHDPTMRLDRRLRWQQWVLPRQAHAAHADLLHVPGFDAPRCTPCPVVLTVHDLIGMLFPQNLPPVSRFYWSRWLPWSVRWASRVIADSEHTRRDIVRLMRIPAERIAVIPLGVQPAFRPIHDATLLAALRQKYGLPTQIILYVGTLEPRKGLEMLVDAYAALASEIAHDLVIAGKRGWYTEGLFRQVVQLGLERRVHFTDYVPDEDLPGLLNLADVFVFPSRYEGFGLPPLEAMACGVPVISSDAASLPEVVGDAGLLFPSGDSTALAAALRRTLTDCDLRVRLQAQGQARARQFTWEATAQRTLHVYEQCLLGVRETMGREGSVA